MEGGAVGAAPGRISPIWQLDWAAWSDQTGDVCLLQSQEWEEHSLPRPLRRGRKLPLWAPVQQSGTPTPAKDRPQDAFIRSFTQDVHAQGQLRARHLLWAMGHVPSGAKPRLVLMEPTC